ncbi:MAG: aminotransferase class V-fold PLP-dependent enzyme [Acidobacteria bacterium]|nr:aminotransferase class V-fold PLP-dependent enzyme [Acidobacteriota bacterium]
MDKAKIRSEFDIPEHIHYLNCAYMAPLHQTVMEAGFDGVRRKRRPWSVLAQDFFEDSDRTREMFAWLIGARPDCVSLIPSVSYGIATAARNLSLQAGQNIVVLAEQFPSNVYPWRSLANQQNGKIKTVERPADSNWTQSIIDAIDAQTAIVALPMCHWTDGSMVHLHQVARLCKENHIALVLDLTQSLGAVPFSIEKIPCDFAVAAAYKWLLGPYSLAYMYVNPKHHLGESLEANWITHEGGENFAGLVDYRDELVPNAHRFDVGERSNFTLLPMAQAALSLIREWGVESIAEALGKMTHYIEQAVEPLGFTVTPQAHRGPHMIGLRSENPISAQLGSMLGQSNIYVSMRGTSIRVAPHLYNTREDLDALVRVLESVQKG